MKSLNDEQAQQTFLLEISRALYAWMMTLDASKKDINLLYFIDEVAPYLPPHPYNPPAKNMIKLLFKQGRKYGVSCALATQNLKDVDYKILSQANTTLLGKVFDAREKKAVEPMLPRDSIDEYLDILSSAKAGEFLFLSTNVSERPIQIKTRWLYTEHGTRYNDEDVQRETTTELREWANKLAMSPELVRPVSKVSPQVNKAEDDSNPFDSEEETLPNEQVSMAEDGDLNVDENTDLFTEESLQSGNEETVEINLLGGLSVLENTRDPLHMMLGLTNVITALAFLIVEISLFENWNEGRIPMIYPMLGLGLTILCGGVFIAESILKDHATLVKTVRERSRQLQLLVLVWAWLLFILPSFTDVEYSELTEACVIIAQTLVTLFFVADISHRFQLKRIDFEFGTSIFDAAKNSAKILIDAPHLRKIQASSEMLLRNIRMISDALAIYILLVLLEILPSLSAHAEYDVILRLFSIMCLNFVAELILRLRGND
jgi:hypothetical protein